MGVLRPATRSAHEQLETGLALMSPDLTLPRYCRLLSGFASLHQTLDVEIGRQLERASAVDSVANLDFQARRKMPWIIDDLRRVGEPLPAAAPFRIRSLESALGALYVTEGATLGGSLIAPHIARVLGATAPVSFFTSYGGDVPRMWSTCRRAINEVLESKAAVDVAVSVAVELFELFAEVLT